MNENINKSNNNIKKYELITFDIPKNNPNTSFKNDSKNHLAEELIIFEKVYRDTLEFHLKNYAKKIRSFLPYNYNVAINIINKETDKISSYNEVIRKNKLLYITINYYYMKLILENNNKSKDINIIDCFMVLFTHEYLHILSNDYFDNKIRHMIDFVIGNPFTSKNFLAYEEANKLKSSIFNIKREIPKDSIVPTNMSNRNFKFRLDRSKIDINRKLLNLACDLRINEIINAPKPMPRAKDFNLSSKLNEYEYFAILCFTYYYKDNIEDYKNLEERLAFDNIRIKFISEHYRYLKPLLNSSLEMNSENENSSNNSSKDSNNNDSFNDNNSNNNLDDREENEENRDNGNNRDDVENNENKDNDDLKEQKELKEEIKHIENISIESYFDFNICKMTDNLQDEKKSLEKSTLQGRLHSNIETMNVSKVGIWKDFKDCLGKIKKVEADKKLSYIKYSPDWTKFNNRKDNNQNLLYPGRKSIKNSDGNIFNFDNNAVLFVDISGSMSNVINPLYTFCYLALKDLDIKLVLYDTEICKIINGYKEIDFNEDNFFLGGGTNTINVIKEYEEKYNPLKKVYIITDGYDYTLPEIKNRFKDSCKIFTLRYNSLKESFINF